MLVIYKNISVCHILVFHLAASDFQRIFEVKQSGHFRLGYSNLPRMRCEQLIILCQTWDAVCAKLMANMLPLTCLAERPSC